MQHASVPRPSRAAEALYFLGYALHGVEDLASHWGRTNAEHSYLSLLIGQDPDSIPASIERARQLAYSFLRQAPSHFGANWGLLAGYQGARIGRADKRRYLGHGYDFGPVALIRYRLLAERFADVAGDTRQFVRWCHPEEKRLRLPLCAELIEPLWKSFLLSHP